jgi:hypothetical protein
MENNSLIIFNENWKALRTFSENVELTCYHISLIAACIYCANIQRSTRIRVSRNKLMKVSRIRSFATYHKCVKDLVDLGYINYRAYLRP